MQLGRRIKELRKKRNITQQDLAEMLGVSYQAISRWENSITSPDITALPVLANIFNVTVDYLLDLNINENTQIIENIYKQSWELCVNQKHKEAQELLEEKTKLFPNNYFLKNELLNIYYVLMYDNDKEIYQDKIIDLANEIINNCLISDYKFFAIKMLILIYGSKNEFAKGKELLELLPDSSYSKDNLKENIFPLAIDATGTDEVYVGRIRRDFSVKSGINMWVVADNTRKGAASNAIQIVEKMLENAVQ